MLVLAKDKETEVETVWFQCVDEKLAREAIAGASGRWVYRMVEDQPFHRTEGRDQAWVLGEKKIFGRK